MRPITIEIPPGELLDRIAILEIKRERIRSEVKLRNVRAELAALAAVRDAALVTSAPLAALAAELKGINEKIWEIEDAIRLCEQAGDFGLRFIELARAVYQSNDRRHALKRRIDDLCGSPLTEEKDYTAYEMGKPP